MKTNLRAICAAALVLFTGCSGKSSSTAKVNLSDISKNTELGEYDNLSVRCNVTLPQVEKLCKFSIKGAPGDDPNENSETNKAAKQKAAKLIESYSGKKPGDDEIIFRKEEYNSGSLVWKIKIRRSNCRRSSCCRHGAVRDKVKADVALSGCKCNVKATFHAIPERAGISPVPLLSVFYPCDSSNGNCSIFAEQKEKLPVS